MASRELDINENISVEDHDGFLSESTLELYERWLDSNFRVPGTSFRFGFDGILGLIPGVGDVTSAGISLVFIADAIKCGARKRTLLRMATNLGLDMAIGLVPVAGDLLDFAFKSNTKNLRILKRERVFLAKLKHQRLSNTS